MFHRVSDDLEVTDTSHEGIYYPYIALGISNMLHGSFFHIVSWTTLVFLSFFIIINNNISAFFSIFENFFCLRI